MTFHLLTIFPEFFRGPFEYGVVGRAASAGVLKIQIHNLRDWSSDKHQTVDDRPFGGGEGMVLKPGPIFEAVEQIFPHRTPQHRVVLLAAGGPSFTQATARRYSTYAEVLFICGRYEGVDERVAEHLSDEALSIGEYVLSGGELAAAVVVDATARLIPGVLGNYVSAVNESFSEEGVLDYPQYTRPADFRGWKVPEPLVSGNHEEIRKWRRAAFGPGKL